MIRTIIFIQLCLLSAAESVLAQHPADVQRYSASGEHLKALVTFQKLPRRRATTDARLAAGRSAWALGLPDQASQFLEEVLQDEELAEDKRAEVHLSRGIVEYQEGRYRVAALYAERAIGILETPGPLRSRAWKLWGDTLTMLHSYGAAEEKYLKSLEEALPQDQPEIYFEIGQCRMRLGKYAQARESFERVPVGHERAPEAIRALALSALEIGQYEQVNFWLAAGRERFPERFIDSWVDYALIRAALTRKDLAAVEKLLSDANRKFAPSDDWLILAQAAAEVGRGDFLRTAAEGAKSSN